MQEILEFPFDLKYQKKQAVEKQRDLLIAKHREEWRLIKTFIYDAFNNFDIEKAKFAKVLAEALSIAQTSERKAWNITDKETTAQPILLSITEQAKKEMDNLIDVCRKTTQR